jgi:hypothetical protein
VPFKQRPEEGKRALELLGMMAVQAKVFISTKTLT